MYLCIIIMYFMYTNHLSLRSHLSSLLSSFQTRSPPKGGAPDPLSSLSSMSIDKGAHSAWKQLRERFRALQREVSRWIEMQDAVLQAVGRIRRVIGADIDTIRTHTSAAEWR